MRAVTRLVLAALPSALLALPASAQGPDRAVAFAPAFPEVDRLFGEWAGEAAHVPGIAYGMVVDGRLAHAGTWACMRSPRRRRWTATRCSASRR